MKTFPSFFAALIALAPLSWASGEEIVLRPAYQPGDSYRLSLEVTTKTEASSAGVEGKATAEHVRLAYDASVVVLEVDRQGRPVRERHEGVRLTFQRPDGSGSLFGPDTSYEVRREDGGRVRLSVQGRRADRRSEAIVAEILASQFEHTLESVLVDPGRPVAVGESWELDPKLVRRFLRERGVRVVRFGGAARASLERQWREDDQVDLVVHYHVPIAWFELDRAPRRTQPSESEALLEGEILLASGARRTTISRSSHLDLNMRGITNSAPGVAESVAWSLQRSMLADERITALEVASSDAGKIVVSERSAR